MSNKLKWLIITCVIVAMVLLVTLGFEAVFGWALAPLPTIVLVFVIYGIGYAWTRSPSKQTEPDAEDDEN